MDKILNRIKKLIPKKLFKALQPAYHFLLSWLAAFIYRWPSNKLIVVGVTGTTGKTTSVYLLAQMLKTAGYRVGFTSTAIFSNGAKQWLNDKKMTMVGRFFTQKILKQMVKNQCQYAIIETTSEGIVQFRHRFINYDVVIFTGLYQEHIDSHGSFANYKQAKGKLFNHLQNCKTKYVNEDKYVQKSDTGIKKIDLNRVKKTIIANGDDQHVEYFLNFKAEEKFIFTKRLIGEAKFEKIENLKIIKYSDIEADEQGTNFVVAQSREVARTKIDLQLLGEFSATNAISVVSFGISQNLSIEQIKQGLEKIKGVPGRLERINQGQNFTVIVDYAFEPRVVIKLYQTIELIPHNNVIHILGSAGGGRDIARRPKLGKIAGEKADFVIVTNEDPYDDDPNIIIDQVATGVEHVGKKSGKDLFKILDRREAIKKALNLAGENDIVLITGKGSEQAICTANGEKIKWDDREVVKEELEKLDSTEPSPNPSRGRE